jgi:hypothetical protein
MFTPAPMDQAFLPYTKRPALKRKAKLFRAGSSRALAARVGVALQAKPLSFPTFVCSYAGEPCGPGMVCSGPGGYCMSAGH